MNKELKKVIQISILVACACIFSLIDRLISNAILSLMPGVAVIIPSFKIGLANIVILFIIYNYDFKYSFIAMLLKSILMGFIYGSLVTFIIGFSGTLLSFFVMFLLSRLLNKSKMLYFISICGGFFHIVGQLLGSIVMYRLPLNTYLLYAPILLVVGIFTGLLIGMITKQIIKLFDKKNILEEDE